VEPRRIAFVTAAARGLARGVAVELARAGYGVALTSRPGGTPIDATLQAVRAAGASDAAAFEADHARAGESARAVEAALGRFGRIDIYVHAVGPMILRRFVKSTLDDMRAMLASNYESAVEGAFAVLPQMRARGFGRLVYFGMNGSHVTMPARGLALYGAAKAAVVTFARALALEEAASGITVNVVEPGDIREKEVDRAGARLVPANNPTGHAGSWEDVASAVRFLVSDEAGFINGMTLGVNGGLVAAHE